MLRIYLFYLSIFFSSQWRGFLLAGEDTRANFSTRRAFLVEKKLIVRTQYNTLPSFFTS